MSTELCAQNNIHIDNFLEYIWLLKGLTQNTINSYRSDLEHFARWLAEQQLALTATEDHHVLSYLSKRYDEGYNARSTARLLSCLRGCFHYLAEQNLITHDPMAQIVSPKTTQPLPQSLTELDVEALLAAPDTNTTLGLRDRSMLELLYGCGLRVSELVGLDVRQLNMTQGVLKVFGKGRKERLVPMGEEARHWLKVFMDDGRPSFLRANAQNVLFPSRQGTQMTRQAFWYRVKKLAKKADINIKLSPHSLRHAFASHLLNHGANLRIVQLLLGHANLSTTQIYTHIARARLNELHATHHPRG